MKVIFIFAQYSEHLFIEQSNTERNDRASTFYESVIQTYQSFSSPLYPRQFDFARITMRRSYVQRFWITFRNCRATLKRQFAGRAPRDASYKNGRCVPCRLNKSNERRGHDEYASETCMDSRKFAGPLPRHVRRIYLTSVSSQRSVRKSRHVTRIFVERVLSREKNYARPRFPCARDAVFFFFLHRVRWILLWVVEY